MRNNPGEKIKSFRLASSQKGAEAIVACGVPRDLANTKTPFSKSSILHDSEKLCAFAPLRENSLPDAKNGSRKAAETQRKMRAMADSHIHDP